MQKNKEKRQQKEKKMHPKIKKRNKQEEKIPAANANRKGALGSPSGRGWKRLFITPNVRADKSVFTIGFNPSIKGGCAVGGEGDFVQNVKGEQNAR